MKFKILFSILLTLGILPLQAIVIIAPHPVMVPHISPIIVPHSAPIIVPHTVPIEVPHSVTVPHVNEAVSVPHPGTTIETRSYPVESTSFTMEGHTYTGNKASHIFQGQELLDFWNNVAQNTIQLINNLPYAPYRSGYIDRDGNYWSSLPVEEGGFNWSAFWIIVLMCCGALAFCWLIA